MQPAAGDRVGERPGAQQQPGVGQRSQQLRPQASVAGDSLAALLNEPKVTEPRASEGGGATSGALGDGV